MSDFAINEDALNDVLAALKKDNFPDPEPEKKATVDEIIVTDVEPRQEVDLQIEYESLLGKISESIDNNNGVLEKAADLVEMQTDDKNLEAYASVAKSNAELLKTYSAAIMELKKLKSVEKMKDKDLALKKELALLKDSKVPRLGEGGGNGTYTQNNFILKASRDEMFDMIFGNDEEKKKSMKVIMDKSDNPPIDAEVVES